MAPAAEEPTNGSTSADVADKQSDSSSSVEGAGDGIAESMNNAVEEATENASEELAGTAEEDGGVIGGGGNETTDVKAKKRKERLEQNRISARESRKRKKTMIEELQRTVITLSNENKELTDRNDHLRTQLMEIASKYPNVVPLQAVMNGAPAASNPAAQQLHQQQQQQAAAVAAAAQATFNPLAFWPQQGAAVQLPPAPAVTPPEQQQAVSEV